MYLLLLHIQYIKNVHKFLNFHLKRLKVHKKTPKLEGLKMIKTIKL